MGRMDASGSRGEPTRVLKALDGAATQLYHFMALVIAGMGFFSDAYDLFSISLVADLIGYHYYKRPLDRNIAATLYGIALCGAIPGQLIFGWLGDKKGRKRIYGVTLLLMVVFSLASGLSFGNRMGANVVVALCVFRFWLGVGIGGDYPLSATIMAEYSTKRARGAFMAGIFAMQGFGNLAAGIVGMVVSAAFRNSSPSNADYAWRIVLVFGAIPAALTYYWRREMPETARYTALIVKDAKKAAADMSAVLNVQIHPEEEGVHDLASQEQYGLFSVEFVRRHGVHLLSTSMCWLVLDISFYALNLFMKEIFTQVGWLTELDENTDPFNRGIRITALYTSITVCGTLPGYFFTVAFVDRVGRIRIQLLGFSMMSMFILCLAGPYRIWCQKQHIYGQYVFAILYGLTFFFANFGPNTTTFIVPAEIFPARLRSTCHGVSGAFGKIGAVIGVFGFLHTGETTYVRKVLFGLVACNIVGFLFTLLLPEPRRMSLEEITGEILEQPPEEDATAFAASDDHIHLVRV